MNSVNNTSTLDPWIISLKEKISIEQCLLSHTHFPFCNAPATTPASERNPNRPSSWHQQSGQVERVPKCRPERSHARNVSGATSLTFTGLMLNLLNRTHDVTTTCKKRHLSRSPA